MITRRAFVRFALFAGCWSSASMQVSSTSAGPATMWFASLADLATAGRTAHFGQEAVLREAGIEGRFTFTRDVGKALQTILDPLAGKQSMAVAAHGSTDSVRGYWARQVGENLRPEWFGAAGVGDDTESLQAALSAIGLLGRRLLVTQRHTISDRLVISQKSDFTISGGGELVADARMPVRSDFQCLLLSHCSRFLIENLTIDGNRAERPAREASAHVIELRSCQNFEFQNVHALNGVADCLYLASTSSDAPHPSRHNSSARFVQCSFINGFRQGVSMIQGRDIQFHRCRFAGSRGTAPSAGVDLESNLPDIDHAIRNIAFTECVFENNDGYGLLVASAKTPLNISATKCLFRGNGQGGVSFQGRGGELVDCRFEDFDSSRAKRGCIDIGAAPDAGHLDIVRPSFTGLRNPSIDHPQVYVHGLNRGHVRLIEAAAQPGAFLAYLRSKNCQIIGGSFAASPAGAITVAGSDCAISDATFEGFEGDIIRISGDRASVKRCRFADPRSNSQLGVIRCIKGQGVEISSNTFSQRASGGTAVSVAPAAAASILGNRFAGFSALERTS